MRASPSHLNIVLAKCFLFFELIWRIEKPQLELLILIIVSISRSASGHEHPKNSNLLELCWVAKENVAEFLGNAVYASGNIVIV